MGVPVVVEDVVDADETVGIEREAVDDVVDDGSFRGNFAMNEQLVCKSICLFI